MSNGPGLSTATGGEIYVGSEIRDSLSGLDVLYANQFERESFNPKLIEQTEKNFYRGAPPLWLNFHISEQAKSDGTGIPLIKRDGYDTLKQQIEGEKSKHCGVSTVKLFHQPGCGGTTLAMQVLWDLRKRFMCAVLTDSPSNMRNIAKEVVQLFTAGGPDHKKPVLLLLNDEEILENLKESITEEAAAQKIDSRKTVVVLFCCLRKDTVLQRDHVVLEKSLSDTEKQKFNEIKKELSKRYADQYEKFHGFNILQTNFSQDYVRQSCTVFSEVQRVNRPPKTQLAAYLALLNAYVPGSYLLESQCLDFLKHKYSTYGNSHLIITFTQNTSYEKRVCMAHPMIAQTCTELMAEAGVERSDTARNFMTNFFRDEVPQYLLDFVKDMLTKREEKKKEKPSKSTEIKKERFSGLILDIKNKEMTGKVNSASVLKVASKTFSENAFFPQALARFYYIEMKDYNRAVMWANEAKKRHPKSSFIADTLGQVYKNHLKNKAVPTNPRKLLQLATKGIEAFKHEEQLAENEWETDTNKDGKVSHFHNTRGKFGYLQVCDILYDLLVNQNETWRNVLTKKVRLGRVLKSLGDNKLFRFYDLIKSLRDDVKKKCDFLNAYLTYSKPGMQKEDPSECRTTVSSCYSEYVEQTVPDLVKEIVKKLKDDMEENESLRDTDSPDSYIAAIHKLWPTVNVNNSANLMQLMDKAEHSYERAYAKYFRSRYLPPLFFIGTGEDLKKEIFTANSEDPTEEFIEYLISKDRIFRDLRVQNILLKCDGKVENHSIKTTVGGTDVVMKANMSESTWVPREVSFYLGFTIRGPVAFGIQTKPKKNAGASSDSDQDSGGWTLVQPTLTTKDNVTTYRLQSERGKFQCAVSALRWVCKKKVSFTYQFGSWKDHQEKLKMVEYTPGGPLLHHKVTEGRLDEVYLPHWICVDGVATDSDKFAVLHSKEDGNFLEQVSEVKSSHVKLFHPKFTTNGVLIRDKIPVKAYCNVLICRTKDKFLTLRVHLIPRDPALQQELEQQERGRILQIENPDKPFQILDFFSLTCDVATAEISPAQIQLSHECSFFTVVMRNANSKFTLKLEHAGECMWSCGITRDECKVNGYNMMKK